ncbi:HWE histidine kinase domain-containing protein [Palleronia sp.]|uniref:HWE histidine kinase domain-containing protein n=1 Tax=Palleronia sp. TaxID=1940284 RepID=UPI0035C804D0
MDGGFVRTLEPSLDSAMLAILDQSRDCITVIETDGSLSFISTNGLLGTGIDRFDAVLGEPWHTLWSGQSRAQAADVLSRAAEGEDARFEAWRDDGQRWEVAVSPVRDRTGRITHLISTAWPVSTPGAKVAAAERNAEMQTTVARESQHRLKNLITVIGSISKLIARRSRTVDEFERSFQRQLLHLDRAQALLTEGAEDDGSLGQVVAVVLEGEGNDPRVTVNPLPTGRIGDRAVQLLALVLGELRTNAIKYGALSEEAGRVLLNIEADGPDLHVVWTEDTGHERPSPTLSGGSGLELIRRMISTGGSEPEISWTGRGIQVAFDTPGI